ncbi:MAG: Holliday junction branch migration protein RuvA [Rhodoluna sp.]
MIAHLAGTVLRRKAGQLVLNVSGVGYLVNVTPDVYQASFTQSEFSLHIAHIIREDAQLLFGFLEEEELDTFNMLCTVTGVGPKSAMSVLAHLGVSGVSEAVLTADDTMFKSVSGVGPKTAKLIVLTLTGKLVTSDAPSNSVTSSQQSVVSALVGLGYQEKLAKSAVESVLKTQSNLSESDLLKNALANLSTGRK